jgi:hypothetical protein
MSPMRFGRMLLAVILQAMLSGRVYAFAPVAPANLPDLTIVLQNEAANGGVQQSPSHWRSVPFQGAHAMRRGRHVRAFAPAPLHYAPELPPGSSLLPDPLLCLPHRGTSAARRLQREAQSLLADAALLWKANGQNAHGQTALMAVAVNGHAELLRELLRRSAKPDVVNVVTVEGWNALMFAAAKGHLEAVKWLLLAGARADLADESARDAVALALRAGHFHVAHSIIQSERRMTPHTRMMIS